MPSASSAPTNALAAHVVPLTALRESPTNPRKYFDPKGLEELAASIREHGILEPLITRPNGSGASQEIICGARRYRAAKMAGLSEGPVVVRDMSDEKVRVIQLVENGSRADLSPVEEAEAYAALAAEGMDVRAIAKTLGKEPAEVAKRLPLAKLGKSVKSALASGLITVKHAELVARIPDTSRHDEALSRMLVDVCSDEDEKPALAAVPINIAKRIVEEEFMTAIADAVFDPEDPELSPLGACSKCPHLAGNNPDLFGDVSKKAICTNPKDFHLKTENHLKRLKAAGYTVLLSKNELKRAFPYAGSDALGKEFIDLESVCADDPKRRRYEELLGRGEKLKIVYALKDGRVRKLYPAKEVRPALVASGHAFAKEKKPKAKSGKDASRSHAQLERIGEEAVCRELAARLRTLKLTPGGWIDLVLRIVMVENHWRLERVLRRHGYDGSPKEFAEKRNKIVKERIEAMSESAKRAFVVDLLAGDWFASAEKAQAEIGKHLLRLAGVDYAAVANRAIDEAKKKALEAKGKNAPKPPIAAKSARAPKKR